MVNIPFELDWMGSREAPFVMCQRRHFQGGLTDKGKVTPNMVGTVLWAEVLD